MDDGLTMGVDRVSQDSLDAAQYGVDDELDLNTSWRQTPLLDILTKTSSHAISSR
jgi:hypothetical protein